MKKSKQGRTSSGLPDERLSGTDRKEKGSITCGVCKANKLLKETIITATHAVESSLYTQTSVSNCTTQSKASE
jgi:energy-coupling factor transporter ATP-binding protein EcfA2